MDARGKNYPRRTYQGDFASLKKESAGVHVGGKMKEFDITFDWDDPEGTDQVFEVRAVGRYRPPVGAPRATNERTFLTAPEPGEMEIDFVTIDGQRIPGLDPEKFEGLVWQELGY